MRKIISAVLTLTLALSIFAVAIPAVSAASAVSIAVSPSTKAITKDTEVTFEVTLTNGSSAAVDVSDVSCTALGLAMAAGTVDAGGTKTFSFPAVTITTAQIGTYTFVANAADGTAETNVTIAKTDAKTDVTWSCEADRTAVASGGKVTLTLVVQNPNAANSGVDMTNVAFSAPPYKSGKTIWSGQTVKAGEKKTFKAEITVTEDIKVTPTLSFTLNGATKTLTKGEKNLVIAQPGLTMELTADNAAPVSGDEVTFTLKITNSGNALLNNIKAVDYLNNAVSLSATSLLPGKTAEGTVKLAYTQPVKAVFTATASDRDGVVYNYSSNEIQLGDEQEAMQAAINITATADKQEVTEPGMVTLSITVKNAGTAALTNLVVSEDSLGEIGTSVSFPVGDEKYFIKEVNITDTATYTISATAKDLDGTTYEAAPAPITVTLAAQPSPSAEVSPSPTTSPEVVGATKPGGNKTVILIIIIVIVVLIVGVIIALVVLIGKEKNGRGGGSSGGSRTSGGGGRPAQRRPSYGAKSRGGYKSGTRINKDF